MAKLFLILIALWATTTLEAKNNGVVRPFIKTFNRLYEKPNLLSVWRSNVKTWYIEQRLDHFNKSETNTWQMRYMLNDGFAKPGGPLFIEVGGESSISSYYLENGLFYDIAREHNGYLVLTEHRYYGKSRPVEDLSNENLKYLDVRQALADLAHFIRTIKTIVPGIESSKVILHGISYAGSMVTWFKKLYPDLVAGCWASSAPLLAKVDFAEFREIMGQSIRLLGGDSCYNHIMNGIKGLEKMLAENRTSELRSTLNICDTFNGNNELDVSVFFAEISDILMSIAEGYQNESGDNACNQIVNGSDEFKAFTDFLYSNMDKENCSDFTYKATVEVFVDTEFEGGILRQWFYQCCNEFGWHATTSSNHQPFGTKVPLKLFTTLCKDAYGDKFTPEYIEKQINKTNEFFGGLNPGVKDVCFTHGQLDAWRAVGIQEKDKATIIPMVGHGPDFYSICDEDNEELKASKYKLKELVKEWLQD